MALQGVQVNVMLKPDRLHTCPSQLRIGRIIRLHRLKMQHYNGRAQGFVSGSSGVSYALAEADGNSTEPVEFGVINAATTAARNPQAAGTALKTPLDMSRVSALRAWNESVFFPQIAAIKQEYSAPISDIETTKPFDLTCLVVGVVPAASSSSAGSSSQELYVWDGTRAKVPTKRYSAVHAPEAGRFAACGSVMCVNCGKAPMSLQLAASRSQVGDVVQLKDCRLSDGTVATAWGPSARQGICFKFRNTGRCDFGDRCRYAHDQNGDDGGGFDGAMSSMFTGAPGTGFNGSGAVVNSGDGSSCNGSAAETGARKSVWHIEFSDFSSFMVLPKQMRAVQQITEQWSARVAAHGPLCGPTAAPSGSSAYDISAAATPAATSAQQADSTDKAPSADQLAPLGENASSGETAAEQARGGEPQAAIERRGQGQRPATGSVAVVPTTVQPSASARSLASDGTATLPRLSYYLMVDTQHTPHVQATSLQAILDYPTVPAMFRCVVRIADMLPRTDHGFIAPFCEYCQRCSVSPQCVIPQPPAAPAPAQGRFAAADRTTPPPLVEPQAAAAAASTPVMICERCHGEISEWTYWSVLKLVDESTSIGALLYRGGGEAFFDGVKASQLRHDRSRLMKLRSHLQTLLQPPRYSNDDGRAQGTVYLANLCLKSYYAALPEGKTLAKGQTPKVCYQIFDSSITVNAANGQPEAKPLERAAAEGAAIPMQ